MANVVKCSRAGTMELKIVRLLTHHISCHCLSQFSKSHTPQGVECDGQEKNCISPLLVFRNSDKRVVQCVLSIEQNKTHTKQV